MTQALTPAPGEVEVPPDSCFLGLLSPHQLPLSMAHLQALPHIPSTHPFHTLPTTPTPKLVPSDSASDCPWRVPLRP